MFRSTHLLTAPVVVAPSTEILLRGYYMLENLCSSFTYPKHFELGVLEILHQLKRPVKTDHYAPLHAIVSVQTYDVRLITIWILLDIIMVCNRTPLPPLHNGDGLAVVRRGPLCTGCFKLNPIKIEPSRDSARSRKIKN